MIDTHTCTNKYTNTHKDTQTQTDTNTHTHTQTKKCPHIHLNILVVFSSISAARGFSRTSKSSIVPGRLGIECASSALSASRWVHSSLMAFQVLFLHLISLHFPSVSRFFGSFFYCFFLNLFLSIPLNMAFKDFVWSPWIAKSFLSQCKTDYHLWGYTPIFKQNHVF